MDNLKKITYTTLLLALVAGFCDTATFLSAGGTFSAHVTGNFIVFAAQIIAGGTPSTWIKLITFPVFMGAVIIGSWLLKATGKKNKLLLSEGILLISAGIIALFLPGKSFELPLVIMTVIAMGLQNAYGKLFPKDVYGPTTMMTGNVTQAAIDLRNLLTNTENKQATKTGLLHQLVLIGGFLGGCLLGGVLSRWIGLGSLLLPGIIVINGYLVCSADNGDRQ
jgi:uncharacterized membrane protein YoaK (UPF0700 family)